MSVETRSARQRVDDFGVLGEASRFMLRIDPGSVDDDIEDAAARADQFSLDAAGFANRGRQTGGLGLEVSDAAVGDRDLHGRRVPQLQVLYLAGYAVAQSVGCT